MTTERFSLQPSPEEEAALELPTLGPGFRSRVVARTRAVRRRRRVARTALGALLLVGLALSLPALRHPPRAVAPAAQWNPALDEDLAWLEESRSRWASDDDTRWAEATATKGNPLRYFFPDYQDLATADGQLAAR